MNNNARFPFRFFLITFIWSWVCWAPLVLGSLQIIPVSDKLLSILTIPVIMLGICGPLGRGTFCFTSGKWQRFFKKYLRSFLDFRLGWGAYIIPIIIFGGSTFIAWFFPELSGEKRLSMLLPSIWIFIPYLFVMIFLVEVRKNLAGEVMLFLCLKDNSEYGSQT